MLYNNTPSNAIVNAVSNISYRPLIQADVFGVLSMYELNNLTNVVIGKLGKLVHKRSCPYWILKLRTSAFTWVLMRKKKPVISKVLYTSAFTLALIWKKKSLYPIPAASLVAIVLYLILISIYILCLCLLSSILMGWVIFFIPTDISCLYFWHSSYCF